MIIGSVLSRVSRKSKALSDPVHGVAGSLSVSHMAFKTCDNWPWQLRHVAMVPNNKM